MEDNHLLERISQLEQDVEALKRRNVRVELDKAWETSRFRIVLIVSITYFLTALVFWLIGVRYFLLNAIIPTLGYYLSTQSLPLIRRWWILRQTCEQRSTEDESSHKCETTEGD